MTRQYRVSPAADSDLDGRADYLASEASLELALRFCDAARSTFDKIAEMPGMGHQWDSSNLRLRGLRVWRIEGFENHLIFYRPDDDGIVIIRERLWYARAAVEKGWNRSVLVHWIESDLYQRQGNPSVYPQ